MFSQTEREFLRLLGERRSATGASALERRFPNPVYRRRLLWGIRQKATAVSEDLELYASAARHEPRVVRPLTAGRSGEVPQHAEPLAALVEKVAGWLRGKDAGETKSRLRGTP